MLHTFSALGCMLVAALALWGWGRIAVRLGKGPPLAAAVEIAIGMATIICVGGVLNALRIAYGPVLDALVISGVGAAVWEWKRAGWSVRRPTVAEVVAAVPLVLAGAFLLRFLVPPTAFNWHDDLERYFSYPVRMLATGTVGGNPLGSIGADSLGAQAFLQGFPVAHFSIRHAGTVDWVFGLLLCMTIAGYGVRPKGWAVAAVLAEVLVFAINPLVVNVSPAFTTACLIIGLVFVTSELPARGRSLWLVGLLYSALLALKTTNALFVGLHFLAFVLVQPRQPIRSSLRFGATILGSMLVLLLPWLLTHASNFSRVLGATRLEAPPAVLIEPQIIFDRTLAAYNVSPFHYTLLAFTGLLVALFAWSWSKAAPGGDGQARRALLAGCFAAAGTHLCLTVWLAPIAFGQIASLRYAVPAIIGAIPAAVPLLERALPRRMWVLPVALFSALLLLLAPAAIVRARAVAKTGVTLAFLFNEAAAAAYANSYSQYLAHSLGNARREQIRNIQAHVPVNEPIVAWLTTPFWLDFERNPVFTADPYAWAMPWSRMPDAKYFLWEYRGFVVRLKEHYVKMQGDAGAAERLAGVQAGKFIADLEKRAKESQVIYNDGAIALWRTRDTERTAPPARAR
jgi:hypothetical protein